MPGSYFGVTGRWQFHPGCREYRLGIRPTHEFDALGIAAIEAGHRLDAEWLAAYNAQPGANWDRIRARLDEEREGG